MKVFSWAENRPWDPLPIEEFDSAFSQQVWVHWQGPNNLTDSKSIIRRDITGKE
jgi:hypothetical protein